MSGRTTATEAKLRRGERLWGDLPDLGPAVTPAPKRMRPISFKPLVKNSLRGFATVELPIGLKISDIPVLVSNGKAWAALPSKPVVDKDGQHKRDVNGKPQYGTLFEWAYRDLSDRFSQTVIALVRAEHPAALDDVP